MIQSCFGDVFENCDGCRQLGDCEQDDVDHCNGLDEDDSESEGDDEGDQDRCEHSHLHEVEIGFGHQPVTLVIHLYFQDIREY